MSARFAEGRSDVPGWQLSISIMLHLAVLAMLFKASPTPAPQNAPAPLTIEMIADSRPVAPAVASAAPFPSIEPAEPVPEPEVIPPAPVPPPMPEPSVPPPPLADAPEAEIPLPPPVLVAAVESSPAPPTPKAPPRPIVHARPKPPPSPQRVATQQEAGRGLERSGTASSSSAAQSAIPPVGNASNGAAWLGRLKQWWDQHSFYPKEAAQSDEAGSVRVHIVIAPDGQITSIQIVQGSGSSVLDGAALAVFRNARLPPLPAGTLAQPGDVVVTLHYRQSGSGG